MYGSKVTMRDGRIYENMDLISANNGGNAGLNLMFLARDNPMAWIELNFNDILTIDKTPPLEEQDATVLNMVRLVHANDATRTKDPDNMVKDVARGIN